MLARCLCGIAVFAARSLWKWTFYVTGFVNKMLKKYMAADQYAAEFCEQLRENSPQLYALLDQCVRYNQPWKLSEVLIRLPNALNAPTCANNISNYLIRLDIKNGDLQISISYSGSAWGLQTSVGRRARQQAHFIGRKSLIKSRTSSGTPETSRPRRTLV